MVYISTHNQVFERFKDIHSGKDAIIFATGPSIKEFKLDPQFDNCIKLGLNKIYEHEEIATSLDYYMFGSHYHINEYHSENINQLRSAIPEAVFLSSTFTAKFNDGRETGLGNITEMASYALGAIPFEVGYPGHGPGLEWQKDIHRRAFYGATIAQPATQFLLYTGVKRIFLVGCDLGKTYPDQNAARVWEQSWRKLPKFLEESYPNVEIVSVNPDGLKSLFTDLYV